MQQKNPRRIEWFCGGRRDPISRSPQYEPVARVRKLAHATNRPLPSLFQEGQAKLKWRKLWKLLSAELVRQHGAGLDLAAAEQQLRLKVWPAPSPAVAACSMHHESTDSRAWICVFLFLAVTIIQHGSTAGCYTGRGSGSSRPSYLELVAMQNVIPEPGGNHSENSSNALGRQ
jgi:hypothetical protein